MSDFGSLNEPGSTVISTSAESPSPVTRSGASSLEVPISAVPSTSSSSGYGMESGSTTMNAASYLTRSTSAVATTSSSIDRTPPANLSGSSMLGIGAGAGIVGTVLVIGLFVLIRRRKKNNIKLPAELSGEPSAHNTTTNQDSHRRKSSPLESNSNLASLFHLVCCGQRPQKDKFRVELTGEFRNGMQELKGYMPSELHEGRSIAELQAERSIAELEGDRQSRLERKRARQSDSAKS